MNHRWDEALGCGFNYVMINVLPRLFWCLVTICVLFYWNLNLAVGWCHIRCIKSIEGNGVLLCFWLWFTDFIWNNVIQNLISVQNLIYKLILGFQHNFLFFKKNQVQVKLNDSKHRHTAFDSFEALLCVWSLGIINWLLNIHWL